jgi:hypothetical protein
MGILRKIFGGNQRAQEKQMEKTIAGVNKIVNDYGDFMQSSAFPAPGCIADTKKLPYDKEIIKTALILSLKLCDDPEMKEMLKVAYVGLADFQDGVGLVDVGLDMRKLPNPQNVDFNDRTKLESISKKMDRMMESFEQFKKKADEERQSLLRDISQF